MCLCDQCDGACCRYVCVRPGFQTDDQRRWAETRGRMDGRGHWWIRSECRYLTRSGLCRIYVTRPGVCRDLDVGGEMCLAARQVREGDR